jgi:hypothetical protein
MLTSLAWAHFPLTTRAFQLLRSKDCEYPRQFFYMAIETNLSRIPLRSLGLSHELIQLLDDAELYTLQDFEDRTSNILRSKYWNRKHLDEITNSLLKQMNAIQELREEYERKRRRWWEFWK